MREGLVSIILYSFPDRCARCVRSLLLRPMVESNRHMGFVPTHTCTCTLPPGLINWRRVACNMSAAATACPSTLRQHLLGLLQQQAQKSGQPRLDQKAILHTFGASRLVQAQRSTPAHWFAQRPRGSTTCDGCSPWSTNLPHGWWERRVAEHSPEFAECPGRKRKPTRFCLVSCTKRCLGLSSSCTPVLLAKAAKYNQAPKPIEILHHMGLATATGLTSTITSASHEIQTFQFEDCFGEETVPPRVIVYIALRASAAKGSRSIPNQNTSHIFGRIYNILQGMITLQTTARFAWEFADTCT